MKKFHLYKNYYKKYIYNIIDIKKKNVINEKKIKNSDYFPYLISFPKYYTKLFSNPQLLYMVQ